MKNIYFLLFLIVISMPSCTKDEEYVLTEDEINTIEYFKEIALGFEFGNATKITRKWESEMNLFILGTPSDTLVDELEKIRLEINQLCTDGFQITMVKDSLKANCCIFFGSGEDYADMFPSQSKFVDASFGLFSVRWNNKNQLTSANIFIDIVRTNLLEQKHALLEEVTQSLGLGQDSPRYPESIFQIDYATTTEYAEIDKELISLLYHPDVTSGLNKRKVDQVLGKILSN